MAIGFISNQSNDQKILEFLAEYIAQHCNTAEYIAQQFRGK